MTEIRLNLQKPKQIKGYRTNSRDPRSPRHFFASHHLGRNLPELLRRRRRARRTRINKRKLTDLPL